MNIRAQAGIDQDPSTIAREPLRGKYDRYWPVAEPLSQKVTLG